MDVTYHQGMQLLLHNAKDKHIIHEVWFLIKVTNIPDNERWKNNVQTLFSINGNDVDRCNMSLSLLLLLFPIKYL